MPVLPPLTTRVQSLIAEAISVGPEQITPELAFGDLPTWDSLGHMEIMLRLEEQFDISVDTEIIAQLISVPEICRYLETKGHER